MKKNFTKVVLASVALAGMGLSYAASEANLFTPAYLEPVEDSVVVEWGVEMNGVLPGDMISLGVPVRFTGIDNVEPYVMDNMYVQAFLVGADGKVISVGEPEEDSQYTYQDGTKVSPATFRLSNEGGILSGYLFGEQLSEGETYAVALVTLQYIDEEGNVGYEVHFSEDNLAGVQFSVSEAYISEVSLACGEEEYLLNKGHMMVTVPGAEGVKVVFGQPSVRYATYTIDQYAYDEEANDFVYAESVLSGEITGKNIGYAAFEPALTFVSGQKYVVTVKAWNTADIFDENMNVLDPVAQAQYEFIGSSDAVPAFGEPEWATGERHELPEDMVNLGLKVSFPNAVLPQDVNPMEVFVKVTASLYGNLPEGAIGTIMPLDLDDDLDPGFGVLEPLVLVGGEEYVGSVDEAGVLSVYLFPGCEELNVGNEYTAIIETAEILVGEEAIATKPEDADWRVDFTVSEVAAEATIGDPVWGIEGGILPADMVNIGVPVSFPDMTLPYALEDCEITLSASLFGIPTGNVPMPLDLDGDDLDGNMGVDGPVCLVDAQIFYANTEGGVCRFYLFPEMLEEGNHYGIMINALTVTYNDEVVVELDDVLASEEFEVYAAEEVEPVGIEVSLNLMGEEVALNSHSAVSVLGAEEVVVSLNNPAVKAATYAIYELVADEENNVVENWLASGELSVNNIGYAYLDPALVFAAGHKYSITVRAWNVPFDQIFDENMNQAEPIIDESIEFNGAADVVTLGNVEFNNIVWGQLPEDEVNLGVHISLPELALPYGIALEDCQEIVFYTTIQEVNAEGAEIDDNDGLDGGFNFVIPEPALANMEGGVANAYVYPEVLVPGKTYLISLVGVQINVDEETGYVVETNPDEASVIFTVMEAQGGDPTGIQSIAADGAQVRYNLNGQKVNAAKGIVIMNGQKVMVK